MDRQDDNLIAARRLAACSVIVVVYSLVLTAGLFMRLQARAWGFVLGAGEKAALVSSMVAHGIVCMLALGLFLWSRRIEHAHPVAPKLVLAAMPVLLFASVDGVLKVLFRPPAVHPSFYVPHPTRDWAFRPGSVGTYLGQPMRINAHGLPGPDVPYEKADDEYRLLFLGDSVAAGFGVPEADCFVRRIPTMWRASGAPDTITVVNGSVVSYSPWQQVDLLRSEGWRYDPDVIVHVFCLNDYVEKFHLVRFGGYASGPYEFISPLLVRSGWYWALHAMRAPYRLGHRHSRDELLDRYAIARLIDESDTPVFEDAWRITFENMSELVAIARRLQRPFVIVCFPYSVQIGPAAVERPAPQARLAEFASAHSVPFLDLLPVFRDYARDHQLTAEELFLDSCHPSAIGHGIAATAIHAFLVEHGLVPDSSGSGGE